MTVLLVVGFTIIFTICFWAFRSWRNLYKKSQYLGNVLQLVENSKDIVYYCETKPKLKYRYLSPSIEMLGSNLLEESMKNPYTAFERVHPDDHHILVKKVSGDLDFSKPIVVRWRNDEGQYTWFEEYATPIYEGGEVVAVQGIIRNIDDKVSLQKELEYKVLHDGLTGVYNREYFESQMNKYDKYSDAEIAVVICDLDGLKLVNDSYGHKAGDKLIRKAAAILQSFSNGNVVVTRIGGDEFALLLINTDLLGIEAILSDVQTQVNVFNDNRNTPFGMKISIGYAYNLSSLGKMEALYTEADSAMYKEKSKKGTSRHKTNNEEPFERTVMTT